jgi:D-alanyl-D-alanine carboxypeptidase
MSRHSPALFLLAALAISPLAGSGVGPPERQAAPAGGRAAAQRLGAQELASALRSKLESAAAEDRFSGAVLVARGDRVLYSGAVGLADRDARTPNTVETKFRMGSMNKMFTATSVLQLVQAGKIKLDAPVGTYLREYPNRDVATRVTIHHLLTHTGGTGNIFGPEFTARRLELRELTDYVKLYGSRGLAFEPGSRWEYSNYGFLLLGVVIERVTGQSYYDYVRDHVFVPAGMTASGSEPERVNVPGRAKGYMREGAWWVSNADTLPWRGTSAGGGYTTVKDLQRFAGALTGRVLLDARHTTLMITGKVAAGRGGKYAYGFFDQGTGPNRYVGHSGGAPGMTGDLRIYIESGYVVAALGNLDSGATEITRWVGDRLIREDGRLGRCEL